MVKHRETVVAEKTADDHVIDFVNFIRETRNEAAADLYIHLRRQEIIFMISRDQDAIEINTAYHS